MKRICYFKGSPREVGLSNGKALGKKLNWIIGRLIEGIEHIYGIDIQKLEKEALPWLHSLPVHFQEELEGIAEGADIPLKRVVEGFFAEQCANDSCTGFICLIDGDVWVARNNDYILPELWGYTIIRDIDSRIPTMIFGTWQITRHMRFGSALPFGTSVLSVATSYVPMTLCKITPRRHR